MKSSDSKTSGCSAKIDAGKVKDSAEVTFTGYRGLPGGRGVVFVELSDAVAVEVTRVGPVIEYKLVGATVPLKNNRNPLLLRDFNSTALSAVLVTDKLGRGRKSGKLAHKKTGNVHEGSARLVITLRGAVAPSYRMIAHDKGAALEVELPPPPTP